MFTLPMLYPLTTTANPVVFKIPAPPGVPKALRLNQAGGSSDTEDDSQGTYSFFSHWFLFLLRYNLAPDPTPVPLCPREEFPPAAVAGPSTAQHGGYGSIQPRRPDQFGGDSRPSKARRVSGNEFAGGSSSGSSRPQHDMKNQVTCPAHHP